MDLDIDFTDAAIGENDFIKAYRYFDVNGKCMGTTVSLGSPEEYIEYQSISITKGNNYYSNFYLADTGAKLLDITSVFGVDEGLVAKFGINIDGQPVTLTLTAKAEKVTGGVKTHFELALAATNFSVNIPFDTTVKKEGKKLMLIFDTEFNIPGVVEVGLTQEYYIEGTDESAKIPAEGETVEFSDDLFNDTAMQNLMTKLQDTIALIQKLSGGNGPEEL